MFVGLLAALSASAAVGMRVAFAILLLGLFHGQDLWSSVPILSSLYPPLVMGTLVSWALAELLLSKDKVGLRVVQIVQLIMSPLFGAIAGVTFALQSMPSTEGLWIIGIVSGVLALLLQLVQVGWFYRLRGLPIWAVFLQDFMCVIFLLLAFDAPRPGGVFALIVMWLAFRSSISWQRWYQRPKLRSQAECISQSEESDRLHIT
ncbi:MAG: DUF4126 domain-containing protein [Leptolyngbyaceae bacterium]|nr:DUF4126 domain-containing protein [Leptolyngbyaceae bacterium]